MPAEDLPDYLDETHQRIAEFAAEFLDDDERDDFVDQLLERHGYQKVSKWAPPDPSGQGGGGGRKPLVKSRAPQQRQRSGSYFGGKQRG